METDKLSIKLSIADRYYPLKIRAVDEEKIRAAAKRINLSVERYRRQYTGRDIQDALSMATLQFVIKLTEMEKNEEDATQANELADLDRLLGDYLEKIV